MPQHRINAVTLEILLHYYYQSVQKEITTLSQKDGVQFLLGRRFLQMTPFGGHEITQRGVDYISDVLATPFPGGSAKPDHTAALGVTTVDVHAAAAAVNTTTIQSGGFIGSTLHKMLEADGWSFAGDGVTPSFGDLLAMPDPDMVARLEASREPPLKLAESQAASPVLHVTRCLRNCLTEVQSSIGKIRIETLINYFKYPNVASIVDGLPEPEIKHGHGGITMCWTLPDKRFYRISVLGPDWLTKSKWMDPAGNVQPVAPRTFDVEFKDIAFMCHADRANKAAAARTAATKPVAVKPATGVTATHEFCDRKAFDENAYVGVLIEIQKDSRYAFIGRLPDFEKPLPFKYCRVFGTQQLLGLNGKPVKPSAKKAKPAPKKRKSKRATT